MSHATTWAQPSFLFHEGLGRRRRRVWEGEGREWSPRCADGAQRRGKGAETRILAHRKRKFCKKCRGNAPLLHLSFRQYKKKKGKKGGYLRLVPMSPNKKRHPPVCPLWRGKRGERHEYLRYQAGGGTTGKGEGTAKRESLALLVVIERRKRGKKKGCGAGLAGRFD